MTVKAKVGRKRYTVFIVDKELPFHPLYLDEKKRLAIVRINLKLADKIKNSRYIRIKGRKYETIAIYGSMKKAKQTILSK